MSQLPPGPAPPPAGGIPPTSRKEWGLDLCQNAIFTAVIRPPEHYPEPGGPGSLGFEPGFAEIRSTHPIRAVEIPDPRGDEVCRHHHGKMRLGSDGFARPVFCSLSVAGLPNNFQKTTAPLPYIQHGFDPNGQIEPGFAAMLGAYHAPWWTEAVFHTSPQVCGAFQ